MSWLIYSIIGITRTYLKENKSRRICRSKSGTDDCEPEFSGARLRNPKLIQGDMRTINARRTGTKEYQERINI